MIDRSTTKQDGGATSMMRSDPSRVIRVAHVVTKYGSACTILRSKLAALAAYDDLEVTVISGPKPDGIELAPPPVRHLVAPLIRPIRPIADVKCIAALTRLFRRERFDIVHTHASKAGIVGAIAARRARVPLVVHTFHGLSFYEGQNRRQYHSYRLMERFACKFRDHVFSQNRRDMADCIALMGSPDKVTFEGNGVDVEFVRQSAQRGRALVDAAYPPGRLRIALVSRLDPVKRIGDFLEACALLERDGVDFAAVVAGQGPMESAIRQQVVDRGLTQRVRVLGWTPHVHGLLDLADIVCLTSEKEGVPRALMEAMALGKPVVATDVAGTQELVVNESTGYLTPLGQPGALADAIRRLADAPELCAQFGQAAAARIEKEFNDVKIAEALRLFYIHSVS